MSGYKCHPIPTRGQGERKRERKRGEKWGRRGLPSKVVAETAGTKLVLWQGHTRFPPTLSHLPPKIWAWSSHWTPSALNHTHPSWLW